MISAYLYGVIAIGLLIPVFTLFYISRVRSLFAAVPRLERPWLLLEVGVVLLFASLLATATSDSLAYTSSLLRPLGNVLLVLTAFFILYAMVTMKRAWTISESD
jgi:protein-S-isoprenylcysteine O-methyltransferase Ste14